MASAGRIKHIDSGRTKARYQYAAIAVAIGATLIFVGVKFDSKDYLIPAKVQQHGEHGFSRLWLDEQDLPAGATEQGSKLSIWRWSGATGEIDLGGDSTPMWSMAPDLSRIAWISGGALHSRQHPLEGADAGISVPLPAGRKALALTELSDGSLAVIFDNASVVRYGSGGQVAGEDHLAFDGPEQAVAEQDYAALGSGRNGILLYQYRPGEQWKIVEQAPAPDLPFRLVITAPGMTAALSDAGLHRDGKTHNTPGAVKSAASYLDDFLIAGDFDKLLVLPADGERYPLADAQPGSLVAASHNRVAVSGADGTRLIDLATETRLTASGRALTTVGVLVLGLGLLLCLAPLIINKFLDMFSKSAEGGKKSSGGKHLPRKLDQPPAHLIEMFAAGKGVLWAGAGLSAQSGLPARKAFVEGLLRTAQVESWVAPPLMRKLEGLISKGQIETAVDELVAAALHRTDMIAYFRAVYYKYVARSHAHQVLAGLPLSGVITTNYDGLLDCSEELWSANVMTLKSPAPDMADAPYLLKLYGDIPAPPTVLLSRFEFGASFPKSEVAAIPRAALAERTLLFVGCSLEGLAHDLEVVGAPAKVSREHFAVVGVSDPDWSKAAQALTQKFGVQFIVCSADSIAEELPVFLENLAAGIEKLQGIDHSHLAEPALAAERPAQSK